MSRRQNRSSRGNGKNQPKPKDAPRKKPASRPDGPGNPDGPKNPRRRQDHLARRAQKEGFAARSVYKLDELQRRTNLVSRGDRVLDLGAAPGSWSTRLLHLADVRPGSHDEHDENDEHHERNTRHEQGERHHGTDSAENNASKNPRRRAAVISVDIQPLERIERDGRSATLIEGDFTDPEVIERLARLGPYNVILSDAAPATSGNRTLDTARSAGLVESALALCEELLLPGGNAAFKLFQGGEERELLETMRRRFESARQLKPRASRDESFEIFLVGLGFRGD